MHQSYIGNPPTYIRKSFIGLLNDFIRSALPDLILSRTV